MDILHQTDDVGGAFEIPGATADAPAAELTYTREGDLVTIRHTEVDEALEGQGLGRKLVAATVAWARKDHLRVRATCSYAHAVLERSPEYADVYDRG